MTQSTQAMQKKEQDKKALVAAQARVQKRVQLSAALLERMGISSAAYERFALNALINNEDLAKCSFESMDQAILASIESGLLPDGREAVIVPMKSQATLIPMIDGRLKLARSATPGIAIRVREVFSDDYFEHEEGLKPTLNHRPNPNAVQSPENLVAVYAIAKVPGADEPEWEVFYRARIDRYEKRSLRKSGWPREDWIEFAKKACLGQLLKRLPKKVGAPELPNGIDPDAYEGVTVTSQATAEPLQQTRTETLPAADPPKRRTRRAKPKAESAPAPELQQEAAPAKQEAPDSVPTGEQPPLQTDADYHGESPF